jgi:hypothetical protein
MQTQNPVKFGDGFRQFACSVRPGNNYFGLRAIEVRAPVRDNPISAVRAMVLPAIADDRVIRNGDPRFIDYG